LAGAALSFSLIAAAEAKGKVVGVSWSNFQEERCRGSEKGH
jgi:D-xylose transport system substrate-binding protein